MDVSRILSGEEIQKVLADLKASRVKSGPLHLAIFRLSCCCGLRRKEISGSNIGDLIASGPRPVLRVRKETTKGRKDNRKARQVPLWWDTGTLEDLRAWRDLRLEQTGGDAQQPLVCSVRAGYVGQRLTAKKIAAQWACFISASLGDERGKQLRIHSGRRSFISHALARGRGLAEVRDAVGHSNVATTNLYLYALDVGGDDLFAAIDREEIEDNENCD